MWYTVERRSSSRLGLRIGWCLVGLLAVETPLIRAQIAMPDPKEMAGIPRPDPNDPNGTVTVRVIRGSLSNNLTNQAVDLHVGDKVQTLKTDEQGRVQFNKLPAGAAVKAVATVDGERLESQTFPAPSVGGIRLMLVATDKEKEARAAAAAKAPAVTGQVVLGVRDPGAGGISAESRIVIEPGDEIVDLYFLLDIVNDANTPVNTPSLFTFDMPKGATSVNLFKESQAVAAVTGTHVRVPGPFPPGVTSVQVVCQLPVTSGSLEISQTFPATMEQLLVMVKKFGDVRLTSPQIERQQDLEGQGAIIAVGKAVPAGQQLTLTLSGLPHHSRTPRWTAITLACVIALAGLWAGLRRVESSGQKDERKRLIARREKLFQDLVRLENEHRSGRGDGARYLARREELLASLERVYGALDTDDSGVDPAPADRTGVPA